MKPSEISACIVTRGNVDLTEILDSLSDFAEVNVWDNSRESWGDFSVYGRYMAIGRATKPVVYVQDDDCIIDAAALCELYEPGVIVANMPEGRWLDYPDSCLVGWGAVFDVELPDIAFGRWSEYSFDTPTEHWLIDMPEYPPHYPWWNRTCDVLFTTVTPHRKVDVGFRHLPWAEGPDRMFTTDPAGHRAERERMLELARLVRDGVQSR